MKTLTLQQGTAEWHAHRAQHFNASDAPAMLGCSPYKTRAELLRELHTGYRPEVDAATQRRFDDGHRFEALARALAEEIIGDDLAPVIGTEGELSASFDGLTLLGDTALEHKTLNDDLRACMKELHGRTLPKHYRVQMEQQILVSGAARVLFMASKWTPSGELVESRHCWYESDAALRAEILAGWKQFAADLATYQPSAAPAAPAVVAAPVQALPAVSVIVSGEIAVRENFAAFEVALRDFLEHRLIREPKTDQDFADLDVQIKAMKGAEAALDSAEAQMLAQLQTVDAAKRTKDMLAKLVRDNRLMAEKLLASEKERRRGEIVASGVTALREHIAALEQRLGRRGLMPTIPADFGGAIKGKKSLASMEDAIGVELARAKIAANEVADRIQVNLAHLAENAEHAHLWPDSTAIVQKAPDDLQALVASRIAVHRAAEERRLNAERERIRAEEQAKAERDAREKMQREQRERDEAAALERQQREAAEVAARPVVQPAPVVAAVAPSQPAANTPAVVPIRAETPADSGKRVNLSGVNAALGGKVTVTAAGLEALGFAPVAVEKAAKLYRAADLPRMIDSIVAELRMRQALLKEAA